MMDIQKIRQVAEVALEGTDRFVVDVKCSPANEIEIVIDADSAVDLDACVELSRAVEAQFDREVEDYELSVYSAGVGQPLKLLRQYQKLVGSPVELLLTSGVKVLATLKEVSPEALTIGYTEKRTVEGKKRKVEVEVEESYTFDQIKWTKEYLDFH
ncbi:MAG: ribosome assembly cofactor RimP [Tidjanibacter sp.]|nr:ribosome assembly cofactor RimP [Tidjanibacter sp.]MBQ3070792.1 ribosome assembly cofactor RimP [Tidjanibacter sp.]MBR1958022.1 ribosome assembly cofactor RimP [Tidjanibacter sp.]MBR2424627.1 ribosome assembly cofactor RimP [Tidjanibacter sp.]